MSADRERLLTLCQQGMMEKGIQLTPEIGERLKLEFREIDGQNELEHVLELYDQLHENETIYPENQPNLLIYHLLDIAPDVDLSKPPVFDMGEFPDVDTDYIKPVQVYLKDIWAPRIFGREQVCSIGNYTTFGIKSAFIDMARVFGCDHDEILSLTTKLGLKDEDGKALTFDKAMEEYPELKAYCERHPDVADAVKKCLHRNRGMGKHAGGLIVSSRRIDELVPLVRDSEGYPLSAWVEGQHGQDLSPMGLIKIDVLVTTCLLTLAETGRLVKQRHGIDYICSDPAVNADWSDDSYLNDPEAIKLANKGDLLGAFQFDSPGIRKLCKGNVSCFDDLVAYNAIYRPGPLNAGMHETYIKRKKGEETYEIHPKLKHILGPTYGTYPFQEQIMSLLALVGDVPPKDCLVALKGISKKDIKKIAKYKPMFIENGKKNLNVDQEYMEHFYEDVAGFASYSFNKSHSCAYAVLAMRCLYYKAHYPIEFYTATLRCEKTTEKIKEYMIDARSHGIRIEGISLNHSKENFSIGEVPVEGEPIYYGFSKIKGLGEGVAEKIVQGQPYQSFEDFLQRFGTDAKVLTPLISLGVFGGDRISYFKFYEHYKDWVKKVADRDKRHSDARERHHQKLFETLKGYFPPGSKFPVGFTDDHFSQYENHFNSDQMKALDKLRNAYFKCIETHAKKKECDQFPQFSEFISDAFDIDDKWETLLSQPVEEAETAYYGFRWTHPLELSPDYRQEDRKTFHRHRLAADDGNRTGLVEVEIHKVEKKPTKKGGVYYQLRVSDVTGEENRVNVWDDDYKIFQDLLVEGNLVKLRLDAPDSGFPTYKLNSPPRFLRHTLPHRSMDFRVIKYRRFGEDYT